MRIVARHRTAVGALIITSILAVAGCAAAAPVPSTPSPSTAPSTSAAKPTTPPKPAPTLAPDASCFDLSSLDHSDASDLLNTVFGVKDEQQAATINVMCALELPATTPVTQVISGTAWSAQAAATVTVESGAYAGYAADVRLMPRRVTAGTATPATAVGFSDLPVGVDGALTMRNATPNRAFPLGDYSTFYIYGAYPGESPVCQLPSSDIRSTGVCLVALSTVDLGVAEIAAGSSLSNVALTPSGQLHVPDESVEAVTSAITMPSALAFVWHGTDLTLDGACAMPMTGGAPDRVVAVTMPVGQGALFCG